MRSGDTKAEEISDGPSDVQSTSWQLVVGLVSSVYTVHVHRATERNVD